MMKKVVAIITCAGKGERAGFGYNKLLKDLGGTTPFEKCVGVFGKIDEIDKIIITCSTQDLEIFEKKSLGRTRPRDESDAFYLAASRSAVLAT